MIGSIGRITSNEPTNTRQRRRVSADPGVDKKLVRFHERISADEHIVLWERSLLVMQVVRNRCIDRLASVWQSNILVLTESSNREEMQL